MKSHYKYCFLVFTFIILTSCVDEGAQVDQSPTRSHPLWMSQFELFLAVEDTSKKLSILDDMEKCAYTNSDSVITYRSMYNLAIDINDFELAEMALLAQDRVDTSQEWSVIRIYNRAKIEFYQRHFQKALEYIETTMAVQSEVLSDPYIPIEVLERNRSQLLDSLKVKDSQ